VILSDGGGAWHKAPPFNMFRNSQFRIKRYDTI
jgi:hypothetical protein